MPLIRGLIYVGGVGGSRLLLILLGAIIANIFGESEYASYVLFLTLSNIVTSFSLMGVVPRILSLAVGDERALAAGLLRGSIANFMVALAIVIFAYLFDIGFSKAFLDDSGLALISIVLYSFGFVFISLLSALWNQGRRHHLAGGLWLFTSVFAFCVAGGIALFGVDNYSSIIFSTVWAVCGVCAGLNLYLLGFFGANAESFSISAKRLASAMLGTMYSGLFGLPFLIVFFWLGVSLNAEIQIIDKSAFFLGFQLFAIATFLPGVLGGVFVPKFAQETGAAKIKMIKSLSLVYAAIGGGWVLLVWFALPVLFKFYGVSHTNYTVYIVILWQVAGAIAALGAIQNQLLVSRGKYSFLLFGGGVWAVLATAVPMLVQDKMLGAVFGVLVAYIALQLIYWSENRKRNAEL
ncbi:hypothetical protein [Pseudomonas sp.]|uniref:hypothetical protein n=1 Tax=Pseudomonas sp. TaxID=306 RepID=UPI002733EB9F|nr:hypothetical protein [Pseudomonas sp.]MDP3816903.1 hypothetical protein [Pseudomonas sp.]